MKPNRNLRAVGRERVERVQRGGEKWAGRERVGRERVGRIQRGGKGTKG